MEKLDITTVNQEFYMYDTEILKETRRSYYIVNTNGDKYRVEKSSGNVYRNGKLIHSDCNLFKH